MVVRRRKHVKSLNLTTNQVKSQITSDYVSNDNESNESQSPKKQLRTPKSAVVASKSYSQFPPNMPNTPTETTKAIERFNSSHWDGKKCHRPNISLISSGSTFDDYRGFLTLSVLLLVLSNSRVFMENFRIFGLRVSPNQWIKFIWTVHTMPNMLLVLFSFIFAHNAVLIEKCIATERYYANIYWHVVNISVLLLYSTLQILWTPVNPATSVAALTWIVIMIMKLWSYAQTNNWYRQKVELKLKNNSKLSRSKSMQSLNRQNTYESGAYEYPMNVRRRNMLHFLICPTLCYEINFPKSNNFRPLFVLRRILEIVILFQVIIALIQQWIVPNLEEAIILMDNKDATQITEQILRLILPNHIIWLTFFYISFHSAMNLAAELTNFADREFYRDWWNAENTVMFWKTWNIPVHKWALRHVYKPLLRLGYSKLTANLVVFTLSAAFHEYIISVPMHMLRFYAFLGMIMQVPLAFLTAFAQKFGRTFGNIGVWLSLICGQPVACLMYVFDYYHKVNTIEHFLS